MTPTAKAFYPSIRMQDIASEGFHSVRVLCSRSTILDGFTTRGGIERDGQLFVIKGKKVVVASAEVQSGFRR